MMEWWNGGMVERWNNEVIRQFGNSTMKEWNPDPDSYRDYRGEC